MYLIWNCAYLCIFDDIFKLGTVKIAYEETCIIFSIILTYFSK